MAMKPVVFDLFNEHYFDDAICNTLGYIPGKCQIHTFPDQETLIQIETPVKNKPVIIIASLDRPNNKIIPLLFAAQTLKELGASKITLIAPYLAYMRQDKQFHTGEGITSKYFAKLLSSNFDALVTIDPHLHRWHSLDEIYSIPTTVLHATHAIAEWIQKNVKQAVLIGPDKESAQWIKEISKIGGFPYLTVDKTRKGDTDVSSTMPELAAYTDHTPVLVDDIISTGFTLIETIKHVQGYGYKSILCIAVHAIFAKNAYEELLKTGITDIVTCNTIAHTSNRIDLSQLVVHALS